MTASQWSRSVLLAAVTAAGYAIGSAVAWRLLDADSTPVFFASAGVTSAALVASRRRHWPFILTAVALTEIGFDVGHGVAVPTALGLALANTAEPLIGALLVRRLVGVPDLSQRRDTACYLIACVVVGPLVGALIGATTLVMASGGGWFTVFLPFWAGDALGVLTVGSAILAWVTVGRRGDRSPWTVPVSVIMAALTAAATVTSFDSSRAPLVLPLAALFLAALAGGVTAVTTSGAAMGLAANVVSARGLGPWGDLAGAPAAEWAGLQVLLAVGVLGPWALAVEQAEQRRTGRALDTETRERARADILVPTTSLLGSALTLDEVGQALAESGIPAIAASGTAALLDESSGQLRSYGTGSDAGRLRVADRNPLSVVVRTGRPLVLPTPVDLSDRFPGVAPAYAALGVRSLVVVPILGQGVPIGALSLEFPRPGAGGGDVLDHAGALAVLAGQATVRARSHEHDRDVAHQLQQALLPTVAADQGDAVRVAVDYRPADPRHEVGGDWYDAFTLPDGRLGVAVGDIVGHDLQAATAMGKLQPALRVAAHEAEQPGEVLRRLDFASSHISGTTMATVGYADYVESSRTLRYACAGHPPPLLLTGSEAVFLDGGRGLPLGVDPEAAREHAVVVVPDPAVVIWYTDGLVEKPGEPINRGLERLRACAAGVGVLEDPEGLARHLLDTMGEGRVLGDDTVVVCVRL